MADQIAKVTPPKDAATPPEPIKVEPAVNTVDPSTTTLVLATKPATMDEVGLGPNQASSATPPLTAEGVEAFEKKKKEQKTKTVIFDRLTLSKARKDHRPRRANPAAPGHFIDSWEAKNGDEVHANHSIALYAAGTAITLDAVEADRLLLTHSGREVPEDQAADETKLPNAP